MDFYERLLIGRENILPPRNVVQSDRWRYVRKRFSEFLNSISLSTEQFQDGQIKIHGVVKCLNKHYWGIDSGVLNCVLTGSWGKQTRVRPPRDIDILFLLPDGVYERYLQRKGNIQSQLLQEVKSVLLNTYSTTSMRGDGQVVMVPFNTFKVEVVPAFQLKNGQFWICDSNNQGRYKMADPVAEIQYFNSASEASNQNARDLVRMLKHWQESCSVPIKSFQLELLAVDFLLQWSNCGRDVFWYDWMVRDFFAYMIDQENSSIVQPGTCEEISLGNQWVAKAKKAHDSAYYACLYEYNNNDRLAKAYWQEVFGYAIKSALWLQ